MKEIGDIQRNKERSVTFYTRFVNLDGACEDLQDTPEEGKFEDFFGFSSMFPQYGLSDEAKHLHLAQGRQCLRIFTVDGIPNRKFQLNKIGGNGWSLGAGSIISEIEGPDAGVQYRVTVGRGISFDEKERGKL